MIRRLLFVPLWILYVVSLLPLMVFVIPTWIVTGKVLDAQLDWYLDQGEKLHDWATR